MSNDIVWRLLRRNISVWQLGGYAAATFAGLAIVLCAVRFYCDVHSDIEGDDPYVTKDYIVISRTVNAIGSLLGGDNSFSPEDIAELESQKWVKRVGEFTSSDFNVSASLDMGGRGMSTSLFLESVPTDFFDVVPSGWHFNPAKDTTVPIVLNKDYLTLYNYGYAASAGLPKISEGVIGMVPVKLSLSGNGKQIWLKGRVVGFSSRLNTIAVPEDFMTWANREFGEPGERNPSRLIIETDSPGSPEVKNYLDSHGYEAAGDKAASGRAAYFLSVATGVVACIGGVICVLAFGILMLSVWLLLQKNRSKLHDLMLMGYKPDAVGRYYYIIVGVVNACVLAGAIIVMLVVSALWRGPLEAIGVKGASPFAAILTGIAVIGVITAINFLAIRSKVKESFAG